MYDVELGVVGHVPVAARGLQIESPELASCADAWDECPWSQTIASRKPASAASSDFSRLTERRDCVSDASETWRSSCTMMTVMKIRMTATTIADPSSRLLLERVMGVPFLVPCFLVSLA